MSASVALRRLGATLTSAIAARGAGDDSISFKLPCFGRRIGVKRQGFVRRAVSSDIQVSTSVGRLDGAANVEVLACRHGTKDNHGSWRSLSVYITLD